MRGRSIVCSLFALAACGSTNPANVTPNEDMPNVTMFETPPEVLWLDDTPSLWRETKVSLFGDQRAQSVGDILTVVIEINDSAEFSNATNATRSDTNGLSIGGLFGIPERAASHLPDGASLENAVEVSSGNSSDADGSIRRNEKLALRVAATVIAIHPNGSLQISGRQNVQLNFEERLLNVDGIVRPEDISRHNEITYDKIAMASISYGGRGQINNMHRPKLGTQILTYLPF